MNAKNYIAAQTAYANLADAIDACAGSGPLKAEDYEALRAAVAVEEHALGAIATAPAASLGELAERAGILASLVEGDIWEDYHAALARRINEDFVRLSAS